MADKPSNDGSKDLVNRPASGNLLEAAFQDLPLEQRQKLIEKALEKKLELDVEAVRAEQRHTRSERDMHNTVRNVQDLESSTKSDYSVTANFETASGKTSIEIKKSNNTTIIVVAVTIAVIFLVLFAK